ncbi:hypothetical protein V3C99_002936, partial [Haemonchus contortus]
QKSVTRQVAPPSRISCVIWNGKTWE